MKTTAVSKGRYSVSLLCALPLLLVSGAEVMRAQVVFTAGTITSNGEENAEGTINVQGSNGSLSGYEGDGSLSLLRVTSTNQTVTFNPAVAANPSLGFTTLNYNGNSYSCLTISLNFSAAPVTVPNTAAPFAAQFGSYSAQVSNVPFSMTGTISVLSGANCNGPVLFTVPISGSGLYSASSSGTRTGGPGGVPGGEATYQFLPSSVFSTDTTTQGAWNGAYGVDGFQIANGASSLPSYATVNFTGSSTYPWAGQTTDPRALQNGAGATLGIASSYDANSFTINVNLMDGLTHRVALYLLDWDTTSRAETITITNLSTNTVYDTETLSNFHNGVYAITTVRL